MKKSIILIGAVILMSGCNERILKQQPNISSNLESLTYNDVDSFVFKPYNCVRCHNSGSVNFTSYAALMAGGNIVAGDPEQSKIYAILNEGIMPPSGKIAAEQLEVLRTWIEQGANP